MSRTQVDIWVQAMPVAAFFVDLEEFIVAINKDANSVLGQRLVGRSYITALRQPDALTCVADCLKHHSEQTTQFHSAESQSAATYDLRCCYVGGNNPGVLVTLTDVTEAQKTSQLHREFVANVSHELRTPLTALMGFIETLQGPAKSDAQAHARFLGIMATETARMNRLVDDLLSLSRVEAQERQQPTEEIDLGGLLASVVNTFTAASLAASVEIALEIPAQLPLVRGDQDQLRQVFTNLIENAIKYSDDNVKVTIHAHDPAYDPRLRAQAVRISVRDTGFGFEPVHAARLTERFYRIDSHRSREMGGTGLGLAIVKHIISRHRGRLEIASELDQGSDFKVILPIIND